jgi:hypothetical protein
MKTTRLALVLLTMAILIGLFQREIGPWRR